MGETARMMELQQQNSLLKRQVEFWKLKYLQIEKEYKDLLQNRMLEDAANPHSKIKEDSKPAQRLICAGEDNEGLKTEQSEERMEKGSKDSPPHSNDEKDPCPSEVAAQLFQIPNKQEQYLSLPLITGCFLLQKRRSSGYNPVKFTYPLQTSNDFSSMYDAIYRFLLIEETIEQIVDDEEESRKNQIFYGSAYEDFHFVFDDYKHLTSKKLSNPFLKETRFIRKQHIFGIVRPEILLINGKHYQTQIVLGFISEIPIFTFFRDFSRIIQQQIKLSLLNGQDNPAFQQRIEIISNIIKNICKHSFDSNLSVTTFPVSLSLESPLCTINLKYSSSQTFLFDQMNAIQGLIQNYSKKKIIKIIHYLLAEKSMVLICKTRKSLNQLFQILKIILMPLNWIFPIVYSYTSFYEPFLSSPLPILIGSVKRQYYQDWETMQDKGQNFLPINDLIQIKAESDQGDYNSIQSFEKRIKKCDKWVGKDLKEEAVLKEKLVPSSFAKRIAENKLCFKLHYYVQQLIKTIMTNVEDDDFIKSFKESQMLSYYNQEAKLQ